METAMEDRYITVSKGSLRFLNGGGEMGQRIRAFFRPASENGLWSVWIFRNHVFANANKQCQAGAGKLTSELCASRSHCFACSMLSAMPLPVWANLQPIQVRLRWSLFMRSRG